MADSQRLQEEADQSEKLRLANLQNDYQRVFLGSEVGLRVLEDLLAVSSPWTDTFFGNSRDIFEKGKRQVGLHIVHRMGMNDMAGLVKLMVRLSIVDADAMAALREEREAIGQFIKQHGGNNNG